MTPLYLRTIELLESLGFAFTLTADGVDVECLSHADAMVEALRERVDQLRPPLEYRRRLDRSRYRGGPLAGRQHYGRPGQVLIVQLCRGRWAVFKVDGRYQAVYQFQGTSERRARARAAGKFPGAPIDVVPNPMIRRRRHAGRNGTNAS